MPALTQDQWISAISAGIAFAALGYAHLSYRASRKALNIAEREWEHRQPALVPYLSDGYTRTDRTEGARWYVFSVSVANPTDSPNTISRIELKLDYVTSSRVVTTLRVDHAPELSEAFVEAPRLLDLPATISAHGSIAATLLFRLKAEMIGQAEILDHQVQITDVHGNTFHLGSTSLREVIDGQET